MRATPRKPPRRALGLPAAWLPLAIAVIALAAACGEGARDDASDEASPPAAVGARLEGVTLPANGDEVVMLFVRLPEELDGEVRLQENVGRTGDAVVRATTVWGRGACNDMQMGAMDVSTGDFFPAGSTASEVIETFEHGSDWEVVGTGTSDGIAWVRFDTSCQASPGAAGLHVSGVVWGEETTDWIFTASGPSEQVLDLLLRSLPPQRVRVSRSHTP